MALDYSTLSTGQTVSHHVYRLDAETLDRYVDAVGDRSMDWGTDGGDGVVPPMSVAALSLRGIIEDLAVPPGSLHAGQELQFQGAVHVGEALECRATLVQNSVRGQWRYIGVQLAVEGDGGREVMTGKSTLVLPA